MNVREELYQSYNPALVDQFEDMLDETTEMVEIRTLRYLPSQVLLKVDPIAYKEAFLEYVNAMEEE